MSSNAISVRGLSKAYSLAHNAKKNTTLGEAAMHRLKHPFHRAEKETFWALKDVSFDIEEGQIVGIIGRNGAGKSTLLKLLSRITAPTSGRIDLYGRVGSLLEVGTGFHPELTGRENVFLNGSILGMRRDEIRRQFDAIVDFAEVEKFLDTPVKRYSSGMYVRLAFAVAAHLHPEILVVDEVLAVGDIEFQKKCLGKMGEVARGGRTVLFVSHDMVAVRQLCGEVILLESGSIKFRGPAGDSIERYMSHDAGSSRTIASYFKQAVPWLKIHSVMVNGSASDQLNLPANASELSVVVVAEALSPLPIELEARLIDQQGTPLAYFDPGRQAGRTFNVEGRFRLESTILLPHIAQGVYFLDLKITDPGRNTWAYSSGAVRISAEGNPTATGASFRYKDYAFVMLRGSSRVGKDATNGSPS